jgi:broad specificity phosphatase PhoE/tRNA A-37 threonylcarbamoyl transferase component Bud32
MATYSVFFVRHGQKASSNTFNSLENKALHLTSLGEEQALAVGRFLKQFLIPQIVVSDFPRAQKTAELANQTMHAAVRTEPRFGERILFAEEDIDEDMSKKEFEKSQEDWSYKTKGGESLNNVVARFSQAMTTINHQTAVFTHGRALQTYLHVAFPLAGFGGKELIIDEASVYRVDYVDGKAIGYAYLFSPLDEQSDAERIIPTPADTLVKYITDPPRILKTHLTPDSAGHDIQKNDYEFLSLNYLQAIGIAVPPHLSLLEQGKYMRIDFIEGKTLTQSITDGGTNLYQLGRALHDIHTKLSKKPAAGFTINTPDPTLNAHNAINLQALTLGWLNKTETLGKTPLTAAFLSGLCLAKKTLQQHPEYLRADSIIYGDFKPDNTIVHDDFFVFIDPHLSYGLLSCDLGKFISRLYLINPANARGLITQFLDGYGLAKNQHEEVMQMTAFDILNMYSRLIAKGLFDQELDIPSHEKAQQTMLFCLETIVPQLLQVGRLS